MYVARLRAAGFRAFGPAGSATSLDLKLGKGLTLLVGENDAGKSSVMDALRYVLLTTSNEYLRIEDSDFHITGSSRAQELEIEVELRGLDVDQQAALLEWLTLKPGEEARLVLNLRARRRTDLTTSRLLPPAWKVNSGEGGSGPEIGSAVRDMVRATYLRPLRDAVSELRPRKASRLSQVLRARQDMKKEAVNNFDPQRPNNAPVTLVDILAQAQDRISNQKVITDVRDALNEDYLKQLSFQDSPLSSEIRMATEISLTQVLERLELTLSPPPGIDVALTCERGLGYNNVLFMATELLLLGSDVELPLLLIEEPEAHLHPQLQTRVLQMISERSKAGSIQVLMSTHSPNLASSAPVENVILMAGAKPYSLARGETMLDASDYNFLRRFLDVTKSNLFFARAVAMVEGPAEELLLPAIAKACGRSFSANGVSVVNVGGVGLFRYARILQRQDGQSLPIRVACVTDRDVVPDSVAYVEGRIDKENQKAPLPNGRKTHPNRKTSDYTADELKALVDRKIARAAGGSTQVFVSDHWTLEYDLLRSDCSLAMFIAIRLAEAEGSGGALEKNKLGKVADAALAEFEGLKKTQSFEQIAADAYEPLHAGRVSKPVVAQYAAWLFEAHLVGEGDELFQKLPAYLQQALKHLVPVASAASAKAPASAASVAAGAPAAAAGTSAPPAPGAAAS